jgi:hypothetical protein
MTKSIRSIARILADKQMHLGILVEAAFVLGLAGGAMLICILFSLG